MLGHTMFNVGRCFNADQNGILRPTGGKLGLAARGESANLQTDPIAYPHAPE
jgi:hypothetical protein